jgi:hypothetical protein
VPAATTSAKARFPGSRLDDDEARHPRYDVRRQAKGQQGNVTEEIWMILLFIFLVLAIACGILFARALPYLIAGGFFVVYHLSAYCQILRSRRRLIKLLHHVQPQASLKPQPTYLPRSPQIPAAAASATPG